MCERETNKINFLAISGLNASSLSSPVSFSPDLHLGSSMVGFPHPSNQTPPGYLAPHLLGYTASVEKLLLPHVSKASETLLGNSNRLNGTLTPRVSGSGSSENVCSNQQRTTSPTDNNGGNNTSTAETSDNSDSDEPIDVVKSAFKQVKSNSRSHPYGGKDLGVRTCRKSPPVKSVGDSKKLETIVISDSSATPTTTQPQKTVWRPY